VWQISLKSPDLRVAWIASFLKNRHTRIMIDGHKSGEYETATGIPQGSPLSPILYLFYNADLIETCNREHNTIATGYIDDIAILRWGDTTEEICDGLSTTLGLAKQWASKHASIFAPEKFQHTHHTRRRHMDTTKSVLIDGGSITPRRTSRYLGLTMDEELKWNIHIQEIKTKATKSIGALATLAGSTWGMSLKDMRRIYQATIIPQILYGCSAWSIEKDTGLGYTQKTMNTLNSLQAKAARIISGAFKATSGPALDTELFLLPMAQQIWKRNAEAASRLLSTNSIPGLIGFRSFRKKKRKARRTPHLSPLEHIYRRLYQRRGPTIERQEVILPYLTAPWWNSPKTYVETSGEQATKKHNE
jgi:hypothetical protein